MKSKESRQTAKAPGIDSGERLRELQTVRAEVAVLREKLFQACCKLAHDDTSIDLTELSVLVFKLRSIEEKREVLEKAAAGILSARAGE
jgi:hypothetical protein